MRNYGEGQVGMKRARMRLDGTGRKSRRGQGSKKGKKQEKGSNRNLSREKKGKAEEVWEQGGRGRGT